MALTTKRFVQMFGVVPTNGVKGLVEDLIPGSLTMQDWIRVGIVN